MVIPKGTTKNAAYLTKLYLSSVGNGGIMNIGLAPNADGLLDAADARALAGFNTMRRALFAKEVTKDGEPFNVVVLSEESYNNLLENLYVMGNKAGYDWIMESRAQLEKGQAKIRSLMEDEDE